MSETIRSQCEGCGMCCRAIYLPHDHDEFAKMAELDQPEGSDPAFAIANWYPISNEEALRRNPYLQTWYDAYTQADLKEAGEDAYNNHFYGCRNLDEETGRCKVHETRPHVCSGYPWYGREPSQNISWYTEDCFYKRDLEQAPAPENMQESIHA